MSEKRILGGYPFRTNRAGSTAPAAAGREEWLIDEAIQESFPASDTPSPAQPGSLASRHYAAARAASARSRRSAVGWIVGTTILCLAIAAAMRRRRG